MTDMHLTAEDFEDLLEDDVDARNRLILHHLAVCPDCYAVAGEILDLHREGKISDDLCTIEIALARTRTEAPDLLKVLERYDPGKQQGLVKDTAHFKSWGLCELLCAESEKAAPGDPARAEHLATLAVGIALTLSEWEPAEQGWLEELRGYTFAHLANARRTKGDFLGAHEAFTEADRWWNPAFKDLGDVNGYEARYCALKASLKREQRHFAEAHELLDQALAADVDPSLKIRLLISKSKTYEEEGDLERAIAALSEAETVAPEDADARVRLCLAQNHLDYLSKAGRFVEAELVLGDVRELASQHATCIDKLRLLWTEARIAKGLGRPAEAINLLKDIVHEFHERGFFYDAALASLERALLYAEMGSAAEAQGCVEAALPMIASQLVEREALAAAAVLRQAVEHQRLTAQLVAQAVDVFRRTQAKKQHS